MFWFTFSGATLVETATAITTTTSRTKVYIIQNCSCMRTHTHTLTASQKCTYNRSAFETARDDWFCQRFGLCFCALFSPLPCGCAALSAITFKPFCSELFNEFHVFSTNCFAVVACEACFCCNFFPAAFASMVAVCFS